MDFIRHSRGKLYLKIELEGVHGSESIPVFGVFIIIVCKLE